MEYGSRNNDISICENPSIKCELHFTKDKTAPSKCLEPLFLNYCLNLIGYIIDIRHFRVAEVPVFASFVTPINLACFSAPGEMAMTQSEEPSKSYLSYSEAANTEKVSMTTLDDFVEQRGISVVDCIKIDAEGSDFEVIRGARRTIERCRPAVILETDHLGRSGSSKLDVSRFFESIDYSVSEIKCDHSTDLLCLPGKCATQRRASVAAESKGFKSQGRPAAN